MTFYRVFNDHVLLNVRLTPSAKKTGINGVFEMGDEIYLKVSVTVVPEDNKANKALIALLAKHLKISKSSIAIIQGQTSRNKVVRIEGAVTPSDLTEN